MNTNLQDIAKSLPDFEDFVKLANEIGELSFRRMKLENEIKARESAIVAKAMSEMAYLVNGKTPSMALIESTYKYTGFNGELVDERLKLADITALLEKKKLLLSIYRDMLEVFRTVSANERATVT